MLSNRVLQQTFKDIIIKGFKQRFPISNGRFECDFIHISDDIYGDGPFMVRFKMIDNENNIIKILNQPYSFPIIEEHKKILSEHPDPSYVLGIDEWIRLQDANESNPFTFSYEDFFKNFK